MKYIPNILSTIRLISVIPLLFLTPFELPFMMIYVVAGVSDMIDGPIARKFAVTSEFGAKLDSIADVSLVLVVVFRLMPIIEISRAVTIWIFIAIAMKFLAALIGYIRYKQLVILHNYANKFFILALFFFPVFYLFIDANIILTVMLVLAMIAFLEEIYINLTSTELDLNDKGILFRNR